MARKKNKHQLRNYGIVVSIILVFSIVGLTSLPIPGVSADNEKTVELPQLDFTGATSDNTNSGIFAKVKQTTYIVDTDGKILISDQSTGIEGNPLLGFVDPSSGRDIGGGIIIPKIFIQYESAYQPNITFTPSTLYLTIQNQLPNGNWKVTESKSIKTFQFTYGPDSTGATAEVPLASFGFSGSDVYADLPDGSYNSLMRFSVSGDLNFHYTTAPSIAMTIPIGVNDLKSWYTAKVTQDGPVDTDGDGINDSVDQCPTNAETYNGYLDTDGCADTAPTTTPEDDIPDDTTPVITDAEQCALDNRIWTNGVCVDDPNATPGTGGTGTLEAVDAFAVIAVKTNYLDGSSTNRAFTQDEDGTFNFQLDSLIDDIGGRSKSIGSLAFITYIGSYTDALQGFKIQSSDLKYTGSIDIASKVLNVGVKSGAGGSTSEAKTFTVPDSDTTVTFQGIELSRATFTSVDIHNAVKSFTSIELVPEGSQRSLDFRVDIAGPVTLSKAGSTVSGNLVGASATFTGFDLINEVTTKTGSNVYTSFAQAELACGGSANVKSIGGGEYQCVPGTVGAGSGEDCKDTEYVIIVEGIETCILKGATEPGEIPSIPGGDDICYDVDHPRSGSLKQLICSAEYRDIWCNGGFDCEVPPSSTTPKCDDTASCKPQGPEVPVCPDTVGLQTNSIASNVCVFTGPDGPDVDTGDFCNSAQSCLEKQFNIDLNDPMTIGIIAIGAVVLLVSVTKRDSRYSPIPASYNQFSR